MIITACGDGSDEESSTDSSAAATSGSDGSNPPPDDGNQAPSIGGTPASYAMVGDPYAFTPSAGDVDGDALSFRGINLPPWASLNATSGRLHGTPAEGDVGYYANVDIEVTDGDAASRLGAFAIDVVPIGQGAIAVSWIPATERVDGSLLDNLHGHRIHWGTEPGEFTDSMFVEGEEITAVVIEGLLPASYYLAATSVDTDGMESALSNAISVTVL